MLRAALDWLWYGALGLFLLVSLALFVGAPAPSWPLARWAGGLGLVGLVVTGACLWQWLAPTSRSRTVEVARCGLLAVPAALAPWAVVRPLGRLHEASGPALVPGALAVWLTIWAVLAALIFAMRAAGEPPPALASTGAPGETP